MADAQAPDRVSPDDETRVSPDDETEADIIRKAIALYHDDEFTDAVVTLRRAPEDVVLESTDPVVEKILQVETELVALLEDILDESKWRPSYESRGIKVSLEEKSSSKLIRIRCDGFRPNIDVFGCCASLMEVECFPEWMPAVDEAVMEEQISRFRKLVRVSGPKPWPLRRDECNVHAYGDVVDCSKLDPTSHRAGVAVYMKPAREMTRTKGRHYVEIVGGWFFEPITPTDDDDDDTATGVQCTLVAKIDPMIRFLPSWAINWVVKNIAPTVSKSNCTL